MIKRLICLLTILFPMTALIGCAAHQKIELPVQEYYSQMNGEQFVPVNVELEQYVDGKLATTINSGVAVNLFRKSLLFYDVATNSPYTQYNVRLKFNKIIQDGTFSQAAKGAILGASLFLIPVKIKMKYDLLAEVRVQYDPIKSYTYSIENDNTVSLFNIEEAKQIDLHSLEILLNKLFEDLIKDKSIPTGSIDKDSPEQRWKLKI